jgi:hypothetical protein
MSAFSNGRVVAILWVVTFVLAYYGPGTYFIRAIEGVDRPFISRTLPFLAILTLILSLVATWTWALPVKGSADEASSSALRRRSAASSGSPRRPWVAATAG